ncbi:hypothetical protein DFA_06222 [Cavenderia fasciculata]|uniref:Uncharacterized protein n=1 Tax=Cavenderia fasciculata TaxID=261658 RepID=F4PKF9_CACFS|nr:uncharacterized protein DFA_06222 [Cavenderia fasciculata]EGG24083.1 hypothetical protein DFA_06222 [Cavenderia fasciculata]|eukprot:XP_004361934.1 hypothetical protein DFA_06222 [Cavenderia fasciculata]
MSIMSRRKNIIKKKKEDAHKRREAIIKERREAAIKLQKSPNTSLTVDDLTNLPSSSPNTSSPRNPKGKRNQRMKHDSIRIRELDVVKKITIEADKRNADLQQISDTRTPTVFIPGLINISSIIPSLGTEHAQNLLKCLGLKNANVEKDHEGNPSYAIATLFPGLFASVSISIFITYSSAQIELCRRHKFFIILVINSKEEQLSIYLDDMTYDPKQLQYNLIWRMSNVSIIIEAKRSVLRLKGLYSSNSLYHSDNVVTRWFRQQLITSIPILCQQRYILIESLCYTIENISTFIYKDGGEWNELIEYFNNAYMIERDEVREQVYTAIGRINRKWNNKIEMSGILEHVLDEKQESICNCVLVLLDYSKYITLLCDILVAREQKYRNDQPDDGTKIKRVMKACLVIAETIFRSDNLTMQAHPDKVLTVIEIVLKSTQFKDQQNIFKYYVKALQYLLNNNQFNNYHSRCIPICIDLLKRKELDGLTGSTRTRMDAMTLLSQFGLACGKKVFFKDYFYPLMVYMTKKTRNTLLSPFFNECSHFCQIVGQDFTIYLPFIMKHIRTVLFNAEDDGWEYNRFTETSLQILVQSGPILGVHLFPYFAATGSGSGLVQPICKLVTGDSLDVLPVVLQVYIEKMGLGHQETRDVFDMVYAAAIKQVRQCPFIDTQFENIKTLDRLVELNGRNYMTPSQIKDAYSIFTKTFSTTLDKSLEFNKENVKNYSLPCFRSVNLLIKVFQLNNQNNNNQNNNIELSIEEIEILLKIGQETSLWSQLVIPFRVVLAIILQTNTLNNIDTSSLYHKQQSDDCLKSFHSSVMEMRDTLVYGSIVKDQVECVLDCYNWYINHTAPWMDQTYDQFETATNSLLNIKRLLEFDE